MAMVNRSQGPARRELSPEVGWMKGKTCGSRRLMAGRLIVAHGDAGLGRIGRSFATTGAGRLRDRSGKIAYEQAC